MAANRTQIEQRIIEVARTTLEHQQFVSPIDILVGIGWLQLSQVEGWRKGYIPYLEKVVQANLSKISFAMKCFRRWAINTGLKPSETAYLVKTKNGKKALQFSKTAHPTIETAYRTHYISLLLSEKIISLKEKKSK